MGLKNDISNIIDKAVRTVLLDDKIRLNDYEEISGCYSEFIVKYIKHNKQTCYSNRELKKLYKNANVDFIRYMNTFYKVVK